MVSDAGNYKAAFHAALYCSRLLGVGSDHLVDLVVAVYPTATRHKDVGVATVSVRSLVDAEAHSCSLWQGRHTHLPLTKMCSVRFMCSLHHLQLSFMEKEMEAYASTCSFRKSGVSSGATLRLSRNAVSSAVNAAMYCSGLNVVKPAALRAARTSASLTL